MHVVAVRRLTRAGTFGDSVAVHSVLVAVASASLSMACSVYFSFANRLPLSIAPAAWHVLRGQPHHSTSINNRFLMSIVQ